MFMGAYLLGAIPFGVVVSKVLGTVDPRTAGSRNVGFTNVLRVGGKTAGALTLIGDMGKGWAATAIGSSLGWREPDILLVAFLVVLGQLYSVFLNFQGGKGVATALGAIVGVAPAVGLTMIGVWLATVAVSKYSSGGALAAFTLSPFLAWGLGETPLFMGFSLLLAALIWWKHSANVVRLWRGTEPKIGRAR